MVLQKKSLRITTAILLVVALLLCAWIVYWRVFSPTEQVRRDLLKAVPFGSEPKDMRAQDSKWRVVYGWRLNDLTLDGERLDFKGVVTDLSQEEEEKNGLSNTYRVLCRYRCGKLYDVEVEEIDPASVNPFHRSDTYIKSWIKRELPVGTDKETVRAWLAEQTELETVERDRGYSSSDDYTLTREEQKEKFTVGVTSIHASMTYMDFYQRFMYIYFG